MGEGTLLESTRNGHRTWAYFAAGTVAVVLVGAVMMQIWRAQPGRAAEGTTPGVAKASNRPPMEIVARVNKEGISYNMLADECIARHGKEVLDDLINRMIIQQACEANRVEVTDAEIQQEIQRIAKRFNLDVQSWYQMLESERNITRTQYQRSIIFPMLALRKLSGEQFQISDADIQSAFEKNYGPRVKCRIIMLDSLRKANEVWDKVQRDPENFEKFAQDFSTDSNSRALGGTVPPIPRHSGNPTLERKAFSMKAGEISGVIEAGSNPARWVILKCEGQTEPVVNKLDDTIREQIIAELHEFKSQESVAKVFKKIQDEARVHNLITGVSTGPNTSGAGTQADGTGIQQTNGQRVPGTAPAGTSANAGVRTPR